MGAPERLRAVAALIDDGTGDLDRLVERAREAAARLRASPGDTVVVYGAAALIHAFYTELEKRFERVGREIDGVDWAARRGIATCCGR